MQTVDNITSNFNKYLASKKTDDIQNLEKFSEKLDSLTDERKRLEEVAKQFEAIVINMMMKAMRKTVQKGKLIDGGMGEDIFEGMLDEQYSKSISENSGFGLARILVDQLDKETKPSK
ncbi:rod-binding protein [bacterium]|nr:rod-binding protein [bacterium]